jgi:3-phenylpropionate/trans-cinnamate dioxygenase ferredoxin reductase subunit
MNVELAQAAGLAVENGILVDEFAVTSHPDIVAAGDCTSHPNTHYGTRLRLESVPNASEQAKSAAASLCGKQKAYRCLPWFWSDLKMQIAGLSQGYDQIAVRGDRDGGRSFVVFYFKAGTLIAADCVNRPQEFMAARRIIAEGRAVSAEILVNEAITPQSWLGH